jgi:hypothetical protein
MTAPWIKVPDPSFDQAYNDYISQFDYRVTVKLGFTYTAKYKEFTEWCEDRLGIRYKDWFLTSNGKGYYTLLCRDNKWMTFLALTHIDIIV